MPDGTTVLDKREAILIEAARIFAMHGFKRTAVDDIAKGAGVGKGTVYSVAESKEDLFFEVVRREVMSWHAASNALVDPAVPVETLLVTVQAAAMRLVEKNPLLKDLFRGETMNMLPKWEPRLRELREMGHSTIARILKIGIDQGTFRSDLDIELVAGLLQDLQLGMWMLRPRNLTKETLVKRALTALDMIINGLKARPGQN